MSITETLLTEAGGSAQRLWTLLAGYPGAKLLGADRRSVVGEIRQMPDGTGVYSDGRVFRLISPEDIEELLRRHRCLV